MTSKADLAKENEKTRRVKEQDEYVKDKAKETVHDVKKGVKDLSNKTKDLDLEDVPDRLIPTVEEVDAKLEHAKDKVESARTSTVGDKDLTRYPKIQQVFKDTERIIDDHRDLLKDKAEDGALSETTQHIAQFASRVKEESSVTLDKLWVNWTALLAVIAGTGAGSWKQILQECSYLVDQLRHTQDFVSILSDLQRTLSLIVSRAAKPEPLADKIDSIGDAVDRADAEWQKQREQLLADWKKVWAVLEESPLWKQLVAKGRAIKDKAAELANETKEEVKETADKIADDGSVDKIKDDFKNLLQLIIGKDGPSVQPFIDYCSDAYTDIIDNEEFSQWASEMSDLFTTMSKEPSEASTNQAVYDTQLQDMYEHTRKFLDHTVNNRNLRMALRECKKLIKAAKKDPATKKLIEDTNKLLTHISDKKGINILDPQLLNEIRAVVVPILLDHFDNAPLPDYHGYSKNALGKYDYTLSDMRLGLSGLVPSNVKVEFRYTAEGDPSKLELKEQKMLMYLHTEDIQVAFKDVKWTYNRHTIPRFTDSGTIDLATAGKGISLKLKAQIHNYEAPEHAHSVSDLLAEPKEQKMFVILRAECRIDDFHVRISDNGASSVFYEMLAGMWGKKIKHELEGMIESKIQLLADKFDKQLYDIVRRATQPSLAQETKESLLSAGKSTGEKLQETAQDLKRNLQSM